ncbi:MAG: hypothetical protein CMM01_26425 [Rhodopirellula sp.]|nr:hypothetical protein [Rhodopirellula sp.]
MRREVRSTNAFGGSFWTGCLRKRWAAQPTESSIFLPKRKAGFAPATTAGECKFWWMSPDRLSIFEALIGSGLTCSTGSNQSTPDQNTAAGCV